MRIMNNISAMNAHRLYTANNSKLSKSLEKLSSGYAINRAGDNAAGLAVSEKMRAQIAGLEQASKNAQDGISMVQTYEGALTETDSILQRMRSLAVQSANGSYDNSVDRVAIEQEFKQLNDELNQIADTDFNGVVVLNGGQMADGTKAVNGVFDYTNQTRNAKQLTSADVNLVDGQVFDDLIDDAGVGRTTADQVWADLNDAWSRGADSTNKGPESVDITFQYDATNKSWSAISATNGADYTAIDVTPADGDVTGTTNGGFKFGTDNAADFANVVIDETKLKNGDTITVTLKNPESAVRAPLNAGAELVDSTSFVEDAGTDSVKLADANVTVTLGQDGGGLEDAAMTDEINKILNAFDGATVAVTYSSKKATVMEDATFTLSDGTNFTLTETGTTTLADGTAINVAFADGKYTISTVGDDAVTLMDIQVTAAEAANESSGTIVYNIGVESNDYDTTNMPTVSIKDPADDSVSRSNALNQSTAKLTYADGMSLQVGARTKDLVDFTFAYDAESIGELEADLDCSARGLGTDKLSLASQEDANKAIDKIDHAINKISMVRGTFGAIQNRLEHKISNLDTNNENLTAAESRIRDTDMAAEMMEFTKNQILSQASQSMLAQANQLPQGVLSLLQ